MRVATLLVLTAMVLMVSNAFRAEAQEKSDLEARVAQLEERIADLETGVITPGVDVRYESVGVTETKGLLLAKNRFSIACRVTPLEEALAPELEGSWPMDNWSFMSCVRFPPAMDLQ